MVRIHSAPPGERPPHANALSFEITALSSAANFGSSSRAMFRVKRAKIIFGNSKRRRQGHSVAGIAAMREGRGESSFQTTGPSA